MRISRLSLIILITVSLINTSRAQKSALDGKKATLHNYMFALADEFQLHLKNLSPEEFQDVTMSGDADPIQELFMRKSYETIEATIEQKTGLDILPKETLEGKVMYDIYGYPSGSRKKAAKRGNTPYYLKLNVQMTPRDMVDEELGVNSTSFEERRIKAFVFIKAIFYDEKGKKLFESIGRAKGDKWIALDQVSLFNGFVSIEGQNIEDEKATLFSILDEAINDLLTKLP